MTLEIDVADCERLIAKLDTVNGSDRIVDGEIFRLMWPGGEWLDFDGVWCRQDPEDTIAYESPPAYTGSVDAALTLLDGWKIDETHQYDNSWSVGICRMCTDVVRVSRFASGRTFPLALCAVALKAAVLRNGAAIASAIDREKKMQWLDRKVDRWRRDKKRKLKAGRP